MNGGTPKRRYDSTVARMAGNIAGSMMNAVKFGFTHEIDGRRPYVSTKDVELVAFVSVAVARAIVGHLLATEPVEGAQ